MVSFIITFVIITAIVYAIFSLFIFCWIGGQAPILNTYMNTFISIFDLYFFKYDRQFINTYELSYLNKGLNISVQILSTFAVILYEMVLVLPIAISIEGARKQNMSYKYSEKKSESSRSRLRAWLCDGVSTFIKKLWSK
jgi:hypothetical protein